MEGWNASFKLFKGPKLNIFDILYLSLSMEKEKSLLGRTCLNWKRHGTKWRTPSLWPLCSPYVDINDDFIRQQSVQGVVDGLWGTASQHERIRFESSSIFYIRILLPLFLPAAILANVKQNPSFFLNLPPI